MYVIKILQVFHFVKLVEFVVLIVVVLNDVNGLLCRKRTSKFSLLAISCVTHLLKQLFISVTVLDGVRWLHFMLVSLFVE